MDFLKIRKKAKDRAAGQRSTLPGPEPRPKVDREDAPAADPAPGSSSAGVDEGELAQRLRELPEPESAPFQEDPARFTTWRPGTGERPVVHAPEPAQLVPTEGAFAGFEPAPLRRAAEPVPAVAQVGEPAAFARAADRAPHAAVAKRLEDPREPLDEFFFHPDEEVPALASLPLDGEAEARPGPSDAEIEEYLTFRLGAEEYAVAIQRVREVLKTQPVTEVPRAPPGIRGVMTVRGEVVPVFDPRGRLGLPPAAPASATDRIVVVEDGEGRCGLMVDAVDSVVRLARGTIEPCPQGIGGPSADCLAGIGRERSLLFTVLDLDMLLKRSPGRGERTSHGAR